MMERTILPQGEGEDAGVGAGVVGQRRRSRSTPVLIRRSHASNAINGVAADSSPTARGVRR